jgi:hypothetical protein
VTPISPLTLALEAVKRIDRLRYFWLFLLAVSLH